MSLPYPHEQRANLLSALLKDLQVEMDEQGVDFDAAFLNTSLRLMGFSAESDFRTDGAHDFGFDHVDVGEREAVIIQSKSVEPSEEYRGENIFGTEKLNDLSNIVETLKRIKTVPQNGNSKLKKAIEEIRIQVGRASRAEEQSHDESDRTPDAAPYVLNIRFVVMARALTPQAQEQFNRFALIREIDWEGIKVGVHINLYCIDDLLAERWKRENDDWRDKDGNKRSKIKLAICDNQILRPGHSHVFFTRAIDLVKAYEDFGYQIFEPNVRAEIHNSPVNREIKRTIETKRGRQEFQYLNNGITFISDGLRLIGAKSAPTGIEVEKPGIVNGLQTVKSLHDAYRGLATPADQEHFEKRCFVLCRVHEPNSVNDVATLIKATNNQNPMKPRNLRSNDPEQRGYEQLFADLGWFYERKEGAWRAFKQNPKRWPKLGNKAPKNFKSGKAEKVVDNELMAQNWLSFIGFSREAINEKRAIFSPENDVLYRLAFVQSVSKHGSEYRWKSHAPEVANESISEAPTPYLLLLAYFVREFYDEVVPGPKESRISAIDRLGIDPSITKEQLESKLVNDERYMTLRVLNGTRQLFVEFVGYTLFASLGKNIYKKGKTLLEASAFKEVLQDHKFDACRLAISQGQYGKNDALLMLYQLWNEIIFRLVTDPSWRRQYDAANVKSRFLYDDWNRGRIIEELITLDGLISRRGLGKDWSDQMDEAKGVFAYLKQLPK